jgi:hypothetical protein
MLLGGILLGLINIAVVVLILLLIGVVIWWVLGALGWAPTQFMIRLYCGTQAHGTINRCC